MPIPVRASVIRSAGAVARLGRHRHGTLTSRVVSIRSTFQVDRATFRQRWGTALRSNDANAEPEKNNVAVAAVVDPGDLFRSYLDGERKVYPCYKNRASQAGSKCERHLVYMRTKWQEAEPFSRRVQGIVMFGRDFEHDLRKILMNAGYRFRQPSRPYTWDKFNLSGTDDGDISFDDGKTWTLIEIKGLHTFYYERVRTWRDFLDSPIYGKYPAQGQLYMLLLGVDTMYFIIGRKGTYDIRFIPMELDYEYAESILAKLERVNKHVADGTLPDRVDDHRICDLCEFRVTVCRPPVFYGPGAELANPDVEVMLDLREKLREEKTKAVKAFKEVDDQAKALVQSRPVVIAGSWQLTKSTRTRKPSPGSTYEQITIRSLSKQNAHPEGATDETTD